MVSRVSEICRDPQCSINSILSEERTAKFRNAVREILLTREIFFPSQVIFRYQAQLFIFFLTAPYRAMELVCMLTLAISSILSSAPQRYWGNLHSPPHNLDDRSLTRLQDGTKDQTGIVQCHPLPSYIHWRLRDHLKDDL